MTDELPKIKSCPWCGSPGKLCETKYNWRVECRRIFDCAARGPIRDTRTGAILVWNRVNHRPVVDDDFRMIDLPNLPLG